MQALRGGITVEAFWEMTPRELNMVLDAANWQRMRSHNQTAWLAWHVAALQRTKRIPPLRRLMMRSKPKSGDADLEARGREHEEMIARMGLAGDPTTKTQRHTRAEKQKRDSSQGSE